MPSLGHIVSRISALLLLSAGTTQDSEDDSVTRGAARAGVGPSGGRTQGAQMAAPFGRLRTMRRAVYGAVSVVLIGAGASLVATPAQAAPSPWWKLVSNSRPTYLKAGSGAAGANAVFKVVVTGSEPYYIEEPVSVAENGPVLAPPEEPGFEPNFVSIPNPATPAQVEAALEEITAYGPGNVNVSEVGTGEFIIEIVERSVSLEIEQPASAVATQVSEGSPPSPDGEIYVTAVNVGDANAEGASKAITLKDVLPPGLTAVGVAATTSSKSGDFQRREPIPCEEATLTCTMPERLLPFDTIEMKIAVDVEPGAQSGELNEATISGGGGPSTTVRRPVAISTAPVPFGISEYEQSLEEEGGTPATQAGAHPFQYTTQIAVNQLRDINPLLLPLQFRPEVTPSGLAKDFHFKLPPGLVGNASTLPVCTTSEFFQTNLEGNGVHSSAIENECPADTAVGVAVVTVHEPATVGTSTLTVPIFNLEPNFGEPARFGFYVILANTPVYIDTSLRSGEHYEIVAEANNLSQTGSVLASTATFWGTPGSAAHDGQRGWGCINGARGVESVQHCQPSAEANPKPFLSLPTRCTSPLLAGGEVDQWNVDQGVFSDFSGAFSPSGLLTGCNRVPFGPTVAVEPATRSAAAPTGLTVDLDLKQEGLGNAAGLAESDVKKVTLSLPTGVTTNPSVANGLQACSLPQYEAEALGNQSCPESSKVGEVEIESPLVKPVIKGSVYVARQHDNPADNLLSIYMVAKNPELGVLVKSAGAVTPNQQTGQLTTTFDELPQLPFTHFHFAFRTGQRAPLITPGLCGRYSAQAQLYPYSDPGVPIERTATFEVTGGANGGPCVTQESQLPNKPTLEAGTLSPIAGAYSPFVFKVKREDGSQALSTVSATLPEGLLGKLAGVKECSNAQIAQAESRSGEGQGALELSSPSCPASSQVGTVNVGTGVGSQPYYVQGKAYLAGPYKGAPLSLAIITPAVVGPFDLGTIVVRTALHVDEETAQITAVSDPIPTIVHGLPTVVQSISLNMNRPEFTINPTSCEPKQIEASATSTLGNVAPLRQRFQVGACNALAFRPGLKIALKGQTKRVGHPALKAVLTYPKGQNANVRRALVNLPGSELLDQGNLNNTCTKPVVRAGKCPKSSIYGKAKAWSPLLEKPLEGPVYLVGGYGYKLPALVAELNGQIRVLLVGKVDSGKNHGIRTTFEAVPDAPVSRFVLEMKGGKKYSLLENSQDICKHRQKAIARFTAQNGRTYDTEPAIAVQCGKGAKKSKGKKQKKSGK
jgi:hypothetical protein